MPRLARPAHPGQFIKLEVIEPQGLSVTDAAKALGVTRPALSALLNTRSALSPEMALRIEKAFGVKMDTLMRMQTSFEIAEARKREGDIQVQPYAPKTKTGPQPESLKNENVSCRAAVRPRLPQRGIKAFEPPRHDGKKSRHAKDC